MAGYGLVLLVLAFMAMEGGFSLKATCLCKNSTLICTEQVEFISCGKGSLLVLRSVSTCVSVKFLLKFQAILVQNGSCSCEYPKVISNIMRGCEPGERNQTSNSTTMALRGERNSAVAETIIFACLGLMLALYVLVLVLNYTRASELPLPQDQDLIEFGTEMVVMNPSAPGVAASLDENIYESPNQHPYDVVAP